MEAKIRNTVLSQWIRSDWENQLWELCVALNMELLLRSSLERNSLPENRETGNGYPDPGKDPDRIRRKIGQPGKQGLWVDNPDPADNSHHAGRSRKATDERSSKENKPPGIAAAQKKRSEAGKDTPAKTRWPNPESETTTWNSDLVKTAGPANTDLVSETQSDHQAGSQISLGAWKAVRNEQMFGRRRYLAAC